MNPLVADISEQFQVTIRSVRGRRVNCYVDSVVSLKSGIRIAYFVKPSDKVLLSGIRDQIVEIAAQHEGKFADKYCLLTEEHLNEVEHSNAKIILQAARSFDFEAEAIVAELLSSMEATITPRLIAEKSGLGQRGINALYVLLQSGKVRLKPGEPIRLSTPFDNLVLHST